MLLLLAFDGLNRKKEKKKEKKSPIPKPFSLFSRHDDGLLDAVGLAALDLLARLGDGLEHRLVAQVRLGHDCGVLVLQRDLVALNACFFFAGRRCFG